MKLKSNAPRTGLATRLVRAGVAGLVSVAAVAGLAAGCLDRPICPDPAHPDACSPSVKNVFVTNVQQSSVDKIDLLFMIDNSASMADKQDLLKQAVPQLVSRLVNPICVDKDGNPAPSTPVDPNAACATGFEREFQAIKDIHIGVVTSSLGGHGATICTKDWQQWDPTQDDHGHLLGLTRSGLTTYNGEGFLAWDPAAKYTPPGTADATQFGTDFQNMVVAAGESGCGYEAQLEAWYRFLVDPTPPLTVVKNASGVTEAQGQDDELLTERANFLRPDSLVAIVMLTDENDCSVADTGLGWLVGYDNPLPSATSVCATNPNDKCCHSCGQTVPGCPNDPICTNQPNLPSDQDAVNLRCWDQKRRFGIATDPSHPEAGLLYPTQRYSNALKSTIICPQHLDLACQGNEQGVPNPLYSDLSGKNIVPRGPDLVFYAGIVGVPWQDIATDGTNNSTDTLHDQNKLTYFTSDELGLPSGVKDSQGKDLSRWDIILGDPATYTPPADPLMHESVDPRTGANPITNDALAPPTSGPKQNPINGHEYTIPLKDDLQYACTFPLDKPKDCSTGVACDCGSGQAGDKPLCQDPTTGQVATQPTQYWAKGYPGLRELETLKEYGSNSIVASICPKITDAANADFGYNPAVAAIIERLKSALSGKCLPRLLDVDPNTGLPCAVVEAVKNDQGGLDCSRPGRVDLNAVANGTLINKAVKAQLKSLGVCDVKNQPSCDTYLLCQIHQLGLDPSGTGFNPQDPALLSCQNEDPPTTTDTGYCYVADNAQGQHIGNADLLSKCKATERQLLRFVGNDVSSPLPAAGATYFIACTGAAFSTGSTTSP